MYEHTEDYGEHFKKVFRRKARQQDIARILNFFYPAANGSQNAPSPNMQEVDIGCLIEGILELNADITPAIVHNAFLTLYRQERHESLLAFQLGLAHPVYS